MCKVLRQKWVAIAVVSAMMAARVDPAPAATNADDSASTAGKTPATPPAETPRQKKAREQREAAQVDLQDDLDAWQRAIDIDGPKSATGVYQGIIRRRAETTGKARNPRIEAMLAELAILQNRRDVAWSLVEPYAAAGRSDSDETPARLVAAQLLLDRGDAARAAAMFDQVATADQDAGRTLAVATEGVGRAQLALKDYDAALHAFGFAHDAATRLPDYHQPHDFDWLINRTAAELAAARRAADTAKFGPDYMLYRDAEDLRRNRHDYAKAIGLYEQIQRSYPGTPYAEAAALYRCYCRSEAGHPEAAVRDLQVLIKQHPDGLYAGEASVLLGQIALRDLLDVRSAGLAFRQALQWVRNREAAAAANPSNTLHLSRAAAEVTRPPDSEYRANGFGFLRPQAVQPGQLFNPATCDWYLKWLKKEAVIGAGFELVLNRNAEEGRTFFRQLIGLDDEIATHEQYHLPSVVSRLTASSKSGIIRSTNAQMNGLVGRLRVACLLGDYYYSCAQFDRSRPIFQAILDGKYGKANASERAYAAGGLGDCAYMTNRYAEAAKHFGRFRHEFLASPWAAQGLFSYAQALHAHLSYELKTKPAPDEIRKMVREWTDAYQVAAQVGGDGYWGAEARFTLGFIFAFSAEARPQGQEILAQVAKRYRNAPDPLVRQFANLAEVNLAVSRENKVAFHLEQGD